MTLRFKTVSVFASIVFLAVVGVFVVAPQAHAGGAVGGGGAPSGGAGSYYTTFGFGWYSYNASSGSGPEAWSSGGPWDAVRGKCLAEQADKVIAFIIQRSGGNDSGNRAKVYKWQTSGYSVNWPGYKGNRGGNWLSVGSAQTLFNSLDPSIRAGYTFGSNVAWFCYQNINYNLTPSVTSDHVGAEPQEPVNVTAAVNNSGATNSTNDTYWMMTSMAYLAPRNPPVAIAVTDNSGQAAVNKTTHINGKPCAYYVSTGASNCAPESTAWGTGTFPVGSTLTAAFVRSAGNTWGTKRFVIGPGYAIGTKVCYALSVFANNQNGNTWAHSVPSCIIIGKRPKVQVHGGDLIVGRSFSDGAAATGARSVETSQTVKYR